MAIVSPQPQPPKKPATAGARGDGVRGGVERSVNDSRTPDVIAGSRKIGENPAISSPIVFGSSGPVLPPQSQPASSLTRSKLMTAREMRRPGGGHHDQIKRDQWRTGPKCHATGLPLAASALRVGRSACLLNKAAPESRRKLSSHPYCNWMRLLMRWCASERRRCQTLPASL